MTLTDLMGQIRDLDDTATPTQVVDLDAAVDQFAAEHPEWSAEERHAARLRLARHLDGRIMPEQVDAALALAAAGATYGDEAEAAESARLVMVDQIRAAVEAGMSEAGAARVAGVTRMTVRNALGK